MDKVSPSGNSVNIVSLEKRLAALKEGSEKLKGIVFTERVGGEIPKTIDLWLRIVQLEPKPLSTLYLYGVAKALISVLDLGEQLDIYEKKRPSDRMKLALELRILRPVAEGKTSRGDFEEILLSTVHPVSSAKSKEKIPIDSGRSDENYLTEHPRQQPSQI